MKAYPAISKETVANHMVCRVPSDNYVISRGDKRSKTNKHVESLVEAFRTGVRLPSNPLYDVNSTYSIT